MKKLIFIVFWLFSLIGNSQGCLKLDIVLLVDVSGSVDQNEQFIKDAIVDFENRFKDTDVRTSLILFAGDANVKYHLGEKKDYYILPSGTTNLVQGIKVATNEFFEYGRIGYRKIVILISDGDADDKENALKQANYMKSLGIGIYGILINSLSSKEEFMKKISDVYAESNYEELGNQLKKMDLCF